MQPQGGLKKGRKKERSNYVGGKKKGHLQLISNLVDWGDEPQTAVDQARFCIGEGAGEKKAD